MEGNHPHRQREDRGHGPVRLNKRPAGACHYPGIYLPYRRGVRLCVVDSKSHHRYCSQSAGDTDGRVIAERSLEEKHPSPFRVRICFLTPITDILWYPRKLRRLEPWRVCTWLPVSFL